MTRKSNDPARRRAQIILQVRSGRITATEAATLLGISRKTYYQWERRALAGMLAGLENGSPGRPLKPKTDPETLRLRKQVEQLENRLRMMDEIQELRGMLAHLRPPPPPAKPKPKRPPAGREKKT